LILKIKVQRFRVPGYPEPPVTPFNSKLLFKCPPLGSIPYKLVSKDKKECGYPFSPS
jgi:hypothetical protein